MVVQYLERLSAPSQARLGGLLALSSAGGWIWFATTLPSIRPGAADPPAWAFLLFAGVVVVAARYGPRLTLADLERRVQTTAGVGLWWSRIIRFVLFWGVWAYWLIGIWLLPRRGSAAPGAAV